MMNDQEYNITYFEACELLTRSKRSVSRYIRRGMLHPKEIRSAQGTMEYRFTRLDLDEFKKLNQSEMEEMEDKTSRPLSIGAEKPPQPEPAPTSDMVPFLLDQIKVKDEQIKTQGQQITEMIERDREKNILLKGYQDRLGGPEEKP